MEANRLQPPGHRAQAEEIGMGADRVEAGVFARFSSRRGRHGLLRPSAERFDLAPGGELM